VADEGSRRLIQGFLSGQDEAVRQIDRWILEVLRHRRAGLGPALDDVAQEIRRKLVVAFRRDSFLGEASLRTYVWRAAQRALIDNHRARSSRPVELSGSWETIPSPIPSPESSLELEERRKLVLRVMDLLEEDCRRLWAMIVFEEQPYRAIAQRLGKSEGSVKVQALRCRRKALEILRRLVTSDGAVRQ